jgi:hypothetical protein
MSNPTLSERMTIFRELVQAQDRGMPVPLARRIVARRYGLTESRIQKIEEEGVAKDWPLK